MVRENAYRDAWLAAISIIVLLIAVKTHASSSRLFASQRADTRALCLFRRELQVRVEETRAFLIKYPRGIPGIPTATIRAALADERGKLDALAVLICPAPRR